MTDHPLRPVTRRRLGEPLPHQQADRPRAHPEVPGPKIPGFNHQEIPLGITYGINPPFGGLSPASGQVAHVLLTRSPLDLAKQALLNLVRLACLIHAASVRSEPESNSPKRKYVVFQPASRMKDKYSDGNQGAYFQAPCLPRTTSLQASGTQRTN